MTREANCKEIDRLLFKARSDLSDVGKIIEDLEAYHQQPYLIKTDESRITEKIIIH